MAGELRRGYGVTWIWAGSAWTPRGELVEDSMGTWGFVVRSLGRGVGIGGCFLGRW
jgi:hypothetical protein